MNKNISELSRNSNDRVNMSFRIASLNAGKINPKKIQKKKKNAFWAVMCEVLVRDLLNKPIVVAISLIAILSMVRALCVFRNKIESCSDKHYYNCWYSDFSSSGTEKKATPGCCNNLRCFYIDQCVIDYHNRLKVFS